MLIKFVLEYKFKQCKVKIRMFFDIQVSSFFIIIYYFYLLRINVNIRNMIIFL